MHQDADEFNWHVGKLASFASHCETMGLHVSRQVAVEIIEAMQTAVLVGDRRVIAPQEKASIIALVGNLAVTLPREAATKVALVIPAEKVSLFEPPSPLFGEDVASKLPGLAYDISEAGKCLALGRSTAAAFHSLRVLEGGFVAIWRCLGIADPISGFERNWTNRKTKVFDQIEARWPAKHGRMAGDAAFFDSVAGAIAGMQNPYRNNTMHFDEKYTDEEARFIFDLVKGLMRSIASRMDENGEPKA